MIFLFVMVWKQQIYSIFVRIMEELHEEKGEERLRE